ncbi:hypothetical protein O181_021479 [Austropuccinia psidii MF-1]|uniref:Palmitoyl-protein thioesterase 1 n=1 Tax=Austropuccinia psidii MF-1 TaxID=1389203 RepID=A0A9Q3GWQ7_9BASI|nr:hypothetical protein [Austropuccinia psidii MF-1]
MAHGDTILVLNASSVAYVHTAFALSAFSLALVIGTYLHYHKIVKNEWYGYPQEWFPSVSATIGDYYPERPIFQILIALTSGPRMLLVFLSYIFQTHFSPKSSRTGSNFIALCGFLRTISCGGWVYVTSSDNHFWHDVMMITYLVLTIPWQIGNIVLSPETVFRTGNKYRRRFSALFFISIVPLVYFFLQHKVKRVPGAYTKYAFIEWGLILYDVLYDSCTIMDFSHFDFALLVTPKDKSNLSQGLADSKNYSSRAAVSSIGDGHVRKIPFTTLTKIIPNVTILSEMMKFSAQVYMGFVFWTALTALGPTIFYFSVWSMGLDGQEVLLFASTAPFLLCLPFCKCLFLKLLPLLRLLSLLSIASYLIDWNRFYDDSVLRLQLTALAVSLVTVYQVIQLFLSRGHLELEKRTTALGIGLVLSVLVKYANYSLNPMWPIMRMNNGGHNRLGVVLGILASLCSENEEPINKNTTKQAKDLSLNFDSPISFVHPHPSWWRAVFGFAGIMFMLHTLCTDSGTIISWAWDGYPITGPTPLRHGCLMIGALCTGLFLPHARIGTMLESCSWLLVGCLGAFGLHNFNGWLGFLSGLLLCIFCLSVFGRYLKALVLSSQSAGWSKVGAGFGLGYLLYGLMELGHTFTVAYAFVPGGEAFRERTNIVLIVTMSLISLGFFQSNAGFPSGGWHQEVKQKRFTKIVKRFLAFLIAGSVMVMVKREISKHEVKPYDSETNTFKAGIWTVHFGIDSGMWESQRRIRDIIQELQLDVVGLLESDLQRIVMGNRDLTQFISEDLGMYVDIGPGPNKHTWGAALLSKFPILNSTHYLLPSPKGELAPAIHATLDMWGTAVDVIISHNGQEQDRLDRTLQSTKLAEIMRSAYPKPFVFLGYVVSRPHEPRPAPYQILVEDGKMLDIERWDFDRWCEYILFRGLKRLGYARVTRGSKPAVTDTELQVGLFQVPPSWVIVDPDKDPSNYLKVGPQMIPPKTRFSEKVGSPNGYKGHRYHVLREQIRFGWTKVITWLSFISFIDSSVIVSLMSPQSLVSSDLPSQHTLIKKLTPVVIWHGLGDAYNNRGLKRLAEEIEIRYPGTSVYLIRLAESNHQDSRATWFGSANDQVESVCNQLSQIGELVNGFDGIGLSQGGQLLRAYVERCNSPKVRNLITLGSQHMGISGFRSCQGPLDFSCHALHKLIDSGTVYSSYAQHNVIPAQYFRDQVNLEPYLENNQFLRDINNERWNDTQPIDGVGTNHSQLFDRLKDEPPPRYEPRNQTYKRNFQSLSNFVMFQFTQENLVLPPTSAFFTIPNLTHARLPDILDPIPIALQDLPIYKEDYIGLKVLDQAGKIHYGTCIGEHMMIDEDCWNDVMDWLGDGHSKQASNLIASSSMTEQLTLQI